MVQSNKTVVILITLMVGVIFQIIFILAENRDTPVKAAVEFSKNYFLLEASMADRLCQELGAESENDFAKEVITVARLDANARGFDLAMVRRNLSHIETEIISRDAESAEIVLHASSRVCINPVFAWVATLFNLGESWEVEAMLSLVQEDGHWKVCGTPTFKTLAAAI